MKEIKNHKKQKSNTKIRKQTKMGANLISKIYLKIFILSYNLHLWLHASKNIFIFYTFLFFKRNLVLNKKTKQNKINVCLEQVDSSAAS